MSSKRLFVAGLSLALIASPALAQSSGTLELGALGSYTRFDSEYNFDNGGGIGGRFGVFLHPMFAIEAEGSYMDIDRGGVELRVANDQANYVPLYLRGTAHFPVTTNGFAVTAGAGLTRTHYRYTFNYGPSAAVGIKIPVLSNAAIRVDAVGDYLPEPKKTNLSFRAGLSFFRHPVMSTTTERVSVVDESALNSMRSERDALAAALARLRDSVNAIPACAVCERPSPAPIPVEKDRPTPPAPVRKP